MKKLLITLMLCVSVATVACGGKDGGQAESSASSSFGLSTSADDPGPIRGKWTFMNGVMEFRNGEYEIFGQIEKATYEVNGNDVYVTDKDSKMHYVVVDPDTITVGKRKLKRIRS